MIGWLEKSMLLILANQFRIDIEDVQNKTPDINGLGSTGAPNTKTTEVENKIHEIVNLVINDETNTKTTEVYQ